MWVLRVFAFASLIITVEQYCITRTTLTTFSCNPSFRKGVNNSVACAAALIRGANYWYGCRSIFSDILVASNHFLELEAKGWKGKRGTALAVAPRHAAFARELIANLSSEMPHHQHGCEWRVDCDWAYIDKRRSGVLLEDRL
jgi:hypothetical protein